MPQAKRDKAVAGIGNERHPSIAHQRDFRALLERDDQFRGTRQFIVFVVADERLVDVVVSEKLLRVARVLAGDLIDFFEDAQRTQGNVFEVADRRADEIEAAAH
jgi:hypothetical protein